MIVEDDKSIQKELEEYLQNAGYTVIILNDFEHAKEELLKANPDLILLDINLPKINGEILLKHIRKESNVPIIMVTSKVGELDEALSISYGADDYITKPYNPTILLLRIQNILKRVEHVKEVITYHDVTVNIGKGVLKKENEELQLTKNEMIIFLFLLNHQERIVTRDELMTELWDNHEYINDNALTVNISRLRSKLTEFGYPDVIQTRKGQGYILL